MEYSIFIAAGIVCFIIAMKSEIASVFKGIYSRIVPKKGGKK
jgi:hypothetical protein